MLNKTATLRRDSHSRSYQDRGKIPTKLFFYCKKLDKLNNTGFSNSNWYRQLYTSHVSNLYIINHYIQWDKYKRCFRDVKCPNNFWCDSTHCTSQYCLQQRIL